MDAVVKRGRSRRGDHDEVAATTVRDANETLPDEGSETAQSTPTADARGRLLRVSSEGARWSRGRHAWGQDCLSTLAGADRGSVPLVSVTSLKSDMPAPSEGLALARARRQDGAGRREIRQRGESEVGSRMGDAMPR
jgi:hypothetical protein